MNIPEGINLCVCVSLQKNGGIAGCNGLCWDLWQAGRLNWGELAVVKGWKAWAVGVSLSQVDLQPHRNANNMLNQGKCDTILKGKACVTANVHAHREACPYYSCSLWCRDR